MKTARSVTRLACALTLAAGGAQAFASTSQCDGVGDNTPCSTSCIVDGKCQRGRCAPIALAPDGAPCSSGNRCSRGDYCEGGTCLPGEDKVVCPSPDLCHAGLCDSLVGCRLVDVCQPDGGIRPVSHGEVQTAPPTDAGDGGATTAPPIGASDGSVGDADVPPDAVDPPEHVRGSGVAGCSMASGSSPDTLALVAVVLFVLAAAGARRRRVDTGTRVASTMTEVTR